MADYYSCNECSRCGSVYEGTGCQNCANRQTNHYAEPKRLDRLSNLEQQISELNQRLADANRSR